MIYSIRTEIKHLAIHVVGNKTKNEPLILSRKLTEQLKNNKGLESTLISFFLNGFKSDEYYSLHHDVDLSCNEIYNYVSKIFENEKLILEYSANIATHLYETGTHPQIKLGELYIAHIIGCEYKGETVDAIGIFKSENKDTFLDVYSEDANIQIETHLGVNTNKLDKGCIIFNIDQENGYIVCVIDNTNRGIDARYWIDDFLHVRQRKDEYYNTHNVMAMCKNYVTKHLPNEFMVTKADQAEILNETIKYFKEQDNFSFDEFSQKVISDPKVVESFNRFKDEYEQERDIQIEDEFAISNSAVKKQSRAFKSVIKLDKNFHIYVHGNNQYIKKGYDETTGMYYYQLFFKEEL